VQDLLRRVDVRPDRELSARFGAEHPVRVRLHLRDSTVLEREQSDWEGFHTRPMGWDAATAKFERLATQVDAALRAQIIATVRDLDELDATELGELLAAAGRLDPLPSLPSH
jgi:2-methylcitrate dehydratase